MSKDSIPLQRPIRPDKEYLYGLTKAVFIMRVAVIGLIVALLIVGGLAYMSMNRPRLVTVVDLSSGKTLTSIGKTEVGSEVLEQQLVYYSRQFCESIAAPGAGETVAGCRKPVRFAKAWQNRNCRWPISPN